MGSLFCSAVGLFLTVCVLATCAKAEEPSVLLYKRNPWLMVIGSDSPLAAVYPDSKVIYWSGSDQRGVYKTFYPSDSAFNDGLKRHIARILPLQNHYNLTDWTDQPTYELFVNFEGQQKTISVYGNLENDPGSKPAPDAFREIIQFLTGNERYDSKKRQPSHLEIMLWPYPRAPDKSSHWPKHWPGLNSPNAIERRKDNFSVYLPIKHQREFSEFVRAIPQKGAVLIDDRKWSISSRYPFPHELPELPSSE